MRYPTSMTRRCLMATAGLALGLAAVLPARAQDTIKVGILHSLSGTMAISETTLKDVMLMLIEEPYHTPPGAVTDSKTGNQGDLPNKCACCIANSRCLVPYRAADKEQPRILPLIQ